MGRTQSEIRDLLENRPFEKHLGIKLLEAVGGKSVIRLEARKDLKQRLGFLHGGVLASLADISMGSALLSVVGIVPSVTVEMSIDFISPVKVGGVTAYGRVLHKGRRISYTESEIKDDAGEMALKATGVYYLL